MRYNRAFTLVELLVAVALTAGLLGLLMSVISGGLNMWQRGRNQIETFATARQTLNRLADELKGATARGGQIEFSENLTTGEFTVGGPSPTPNPQPTPQIGVSENLFFVAPYPNTAAGDLCVIAYRHIDTDQSAGGTNSHTLQRGLVDSQNAWSSAARYRSSGYSTVDWRTIARGVLEFEVKAYSQTDLDTNATPSPWPSWNSEGVTTGMAGNTPRRIVVRMKVIDEKALARLNALPATGVARDRVIAQSVREFTADVSLPPPR